MQRLKNLFGGKKKGEERNNNNYNYNTHNHGHHSHSHSHKKNHESKKVFGIPLDPSSLTVPPIVQKMVNYLKVHGMWCIFYLFIIYSCFYSYKINVRE